ncbi:MAG: M1 family metallopeptidase [Taibaiella sp.]|nr:M1 family metallopeptidase [Taibaiella sp.]
MKQFVFFLLLLSSVRLSAQTYWQQHVDTKIEVRLDDRNHFLHAHEEIIYTNNSPDTLQSIYLHIWPNAYKNDHTPFAKQLELNGTTSFYYAKSADRGYIDSLDFTVDGLGAEHFIAENTPDITRIDLRAPLLPGKSIKIETPFLVKLPKVFSRLGHTDQAYYISQWFPKPAVYDRLGWHPISFLDQGEFYSEYGSYDVSITLPRNYIVMATGNCLDEKENTWLDSLARLLLPSDTSNNNEIPASALETKTVHFHEDNVHDFAWFADKRWVVRKDTVTSPGSGKVIAVWAAFWPSYSRIWAGATEDLRETVLHYGKWVGAYPYNTIKAVLGDMRAGGGMEYPTITVIDKSARTGFRTVVVHEAGHNWFYGLLGSNERDHAWMDEGLNTFYEKKTTKALKQEKDIFTAVTRLNEDLFYYELAATHNDQPIEQTSAAFSKLNYGIDVYYKTALLLNWLQQYMGEADFEKGMKYYFDTWHFKHPYPADFRECMQRNTTKPLGWFFEGMLTTSHKIDFTITKARIKGDSTEIAIKNNSKIAAPVLVKAYLRDSLLTERWTEPFMSKTTLTIPGTTWNKLKIDSLAPDAKSANDVYSRYGLSHRFRLKVKPFIGLNLSHEEKLFIAPALGYNQYDGISAGLLFHNITLPENRFRFLLAPMYSFETAGLVGAGSVGYVWYPKVAFKEIMLQGDAKMFHYNETGLNTNGTLYAGYTKTALSLDFTLNENEGQSTVCRTLLLKGYNVMEDNYNFGAGNTTITTSQKVYGLVKYHHNNTRTFNPFQYAIEAQLGADFAKIGAEGIARVDYNRKGKALRVRAFAGKFIAVTNDPAVTQRYNLNASFSAVNDYLYDGTYLGRSATSKLAAQQISIQEGGFKIPVLNNVYRSDNWLATINLSSDLPIKYLPVRLFFDAGLTPNFKPTLERNSSSTFLYEGGVEVSLINNFISVYVPIIMSSDFQNYLTDTYGKKSFARGISFTLNLQNVNWLKSPVRFMKMAVN